MRRTTILAAALGATIFTPIAVSAPSANNGLSSPRPILAQATEEKAKDDAAGNKGERPRRGQAPAAKGEAPKAPAAAKEAAPKAPAAREGAPRPQVQDRQLPRAPAATKSERVAPPDRGAEKSRQDAAEAARKARQDAAEAARKAKQDAEAKAAAERKAKQDAQRARPEPKTLEPKTLQPKSAAPKAPEPKAKAADDRRGPLQQQQIQRQPQQTDDRTRARDRRDDAGIRERSQRLEAQKTSRDDLSRTRVEEGRRVTIDGGSRTLIREDNRVVIRSNDDDRFRLGRNDRRGDPRVERLPGGQTRTIIVYPDGSQIITVTGPRGEIVYRARRPRGGRDIVLIREISRPPLVRIDLGPLQLRIPREQYIVDSRRASRNDLFIALSAPPVEPIERIYSLEEVRSFDRIRDKMRRIDVSDITFETDSAVITADQAGALEELASVINDLIRRNPGETFLVEGHTDAVGSDVYNLALSDRRAEAVAIALSEYFDVPPENLVTQGYGEQFLKILTEEPERENRRTALRRVTPLVNQVAN